MSDVNSLPGGAGNGTLTLRIQNTTGGTVTDWSFFADAWYASTGTTATLTFAYSTDNVNFTTFDTRTSTATTSAFNGATTRLDTTQWSSQQKFGDSFSATVLDQEYLYISFTTHNNGVGAGGFQAGAHWILDNLAITAIPEPSAFALLFGVGALGAVALRRRRR